MGAFWIELKRRVKTASWALIGAGVAVVMATLYLFRKKSQDRPYAARMGPAIDNVHARIEAANARAKVEVVIAETKEKDVAAELRAIDADKDADNQRQRLIELAARVEGRGK